MLLSDGLLGEREEPSSLGPRGACERELAAEMHAVDMYRLKSPADELLLKVLDGNFLHPLQISK